MLRKKKQRTSEMRGAGGALRDLVIANVPCSCQYTSEYEEYLRLMSALTSTATTPEERFTIFLKYHYDGKQVEHVCDACRAVNQWDDLLETV